MDDMELSAKDKVELEKLIQEFSKVLQCINSWVMDEYYFL